SWRNVRSVRIARSCSPIDRGPQMSKPISPLRQRMIDDMTMRNLSPSSQETYIRAVAQFSAFHRRSPDKLGVQHLREYQLHLVSRGRTANSICRKMRALRFYYGHRVSRPDIERDILRQRQWNLRAALLAHAEGERLLNGLRKLKTRLGCIPN